MKKFVRHKDADKRIASATSLIKLLLANRTSEVLLRHTRELLTILLWKLTEAESSKYRTRFQSRGAQGIVDKKQLNHDHVYQRSRMIDDLLSASPDKLDAILQTAVGCTVTRQEHTLLKRFGNEDGWERYKQAGFLL